MPLRTQLQPVVISGPEPHDLFTGADGVARITVCKDSPVYRRKGVNCAVHGRGSLLLLLVASSQGYIVFGQGRSVNSKNTG